jgi:hypothetical protein
MQISWMGKDGKSIPLYVIQKQKEIKDNRYSWLISDKADIKLKGITKI